MNTSLSPQVISEIAVGTTRAQEFIKTLRLEQALPAEAIEELKTLQIEFGSDSPAIGAWLAEIAKRAR